MPKAQRKANFGEACPLKAPCDIQALGKVGIALGKPWCIAISFPKTDVEQARAYPQGSLFPSPLRP
jgi:hypothetical protein